MSLKTNQQGMTLIEVMVALAIFSYAALTLLSASSANLNSHGRLKNKTYADWVAQNQLAEFVLTYKPSAQKNTTKGKEEIAGQIFYYQVKVEDNGSEWLNSVVVDVSTDEEMKYLTSTITGFVEKP